MDVFSRISKLKIQDKISILVLLAILLYRGIGYIEKSLIAVNYAPLRADGKIVIVTGANSGLGFYTSLFIANRGGQVVMGCRNMAACTEATNLIISQNASAVKPVPLELDLASFSSIKAFAAKVASKFSTIDVLVNNAGIMATFPRSETKDGIESQVGVNHFGHFLLTSLLYPRLTKGGRIVNHSSGAHAFGSTDAIFEDYQTHNYTSWTTWKAYGISKSFNLQFTYELNDRLQKKGNPKDIVAVAVHPGYTATNLQKEKYPFWDYANALMAMSLVDGSQSQILAAIAPTVSASNNTFFGPRYAAFGAPSVTSTGKYNKLAQVRLWQESERLTKKSFDI